MPTTYEKVLCRTQSIPENWHQRKVQEDPRNLQQKRSKGMQQLPFRQILLTLKMLYTLEDFHHPWEMVFQNKLVVLQSEKFHHTNDKGLLITKLFKYLVLDKGTWLQASKIIIYLICCTIWHEFVSFQKYLQLFYFSAIFMTLRNVYPERLTSYAVQNLANYTILVFIIGRIHAGFLFTI